MHRIIEGLDALVDRLCDWLNNNISGRHPFAAAGNALAGLAAERILPVDRRIGPELILMGKRVHKVKSGETVSGIAKKYGIKDWKKDLWDKQPPQFLKAHPKGPDLIFPGDELVIPDSGGPVGKYAKGADKACNFWALCGMAGYPCTRCGGRNGFDGKKQTCPSGTVLGRWWEGCCADPGGQKRWLYWYDCCLKKGAGATKPCGGVACSNASVADWCTGVGHYYCTAIFHIPKKDKDCK